MANETDACRSEKLALIQGARSNPFNQEETNRTDTDYTPPVYSDEVSAKLTARKEEAAARGWYEIDARLVSFLHLIFGADMEHHDGTADLTVVVDGQVISGTVLSEAVRAKLQADSIRKNADCTARGLDLMQELTADHRSTVIDQEAENP